MRFLLALFRMDMPLWKAFWGVGVLGNALLGYLRGVLLLILLQDVDPIEQEEALDALLMGEGEIEGALYAIGLLAVISAFISLFYALWSFYCVWYNAGRYDGPPLWKYLARIVIIIGGFEMMGDMISLTPTE